MPDLTIEIARYCASLNGYRRTVEGSKGAKYLVEYGPLYGPRLDGAKTLNGWTCTCPDFFARHLHAGTNCKHIEAVKKLPMTEGGPCFWNAVLEPGISGAGPRHDRCPRCKGPTALARVAV